MHCLIGHPPLPPPRLQEEEAAQESAYDFLSPFLPTLLGSQQLTRGQALEVREKTLKALKDRLIERANIIQVGAGGGGAAAGEGGSWLERQCMPRQLTRMALPVDWHCTPADANGRGLLHGIARKAREDRVVEA